MSIREARKIQSARIARQSAKTPLRFRPVIIVTESESFRVMELGEAEKAGLREFIVR